MNGLDEATRLTESAEDYLEVIGQLCDEHGCAQVSDIARLLDVKKPSVTAAVKNLSDLGLVEYRQYAPIRLTPQGKLYAARVQRAHDIIKRFLIELVGMSDERAEHVGCHMEHMLTGEEVDLLRAKLPAENLNKSSASDI